METPAPFHLYMKIKYTGLQETIFVNMIVECVEYKRHFVRNEWTNIHDDKIAKALLKSKFFISEDNLKFDNCDKQQPILLQRNYALGDLIMLVPVVKYMKRALGMRFSLITSPCFVDIMRWFGIFDEVYSSMPKRGYKNYLILDGVLESDHSLTNHTRQMHRIKIYEEFFKVTVDYYDFKPERNNG